MSSTSSHALSHQRLGRIDGRRHADNFPRNHTIVGQFNQREPESTLRYAAHHCLYGKNFPLIVTFTRSPFGSGTFST